MQTERPNSYRPLTSRATEAPDYLFWRSKDLWSLNEAAKLICGRDPIQKYPRPQTHNRGVKVIDVIDAAAKAAEHSQLPVVRKGLIAIHIQVHPPEFVRWALQTGYEVPDELRGLAEQEVCEETPEDLVVKDRIQTVARTLWAIDPMMQLDQVFRHRAMRQIVGPNIVAYDQFVGWVAEYQPLPTTDQ